MFGPVDGQPCAAIWWAGKAILPDDPAMYSNRVAHCCPLQQLGLQLCHAADVCGATQAPTCTCSGGGAGVSMSEGCAADTTAAPTTAGVHFDGGVCCEVFGYACMMCSRELLGHGCLHPVLSWLASSSVVGKQQCKAPVGRWVPCAPAQRGGGCGWWCQMPSASEAMHALQRFGWQCQHPPGRMAACAAWTQVPSAPDALQTLCNS
jgi:hypothetical protein